MTTQYIPDIERALRAVGDLLAADGKRASIVIVGGAAMNLLGVRKRTTRDVDVLASGKPGGGRLRRPDPLPLALRQAAATVARDLGLPPDWLNTQVAGQWDTGLPRGLAQRVKWKRYAGLAVGIAGRQDLVFLKLYAAADDTGPHSVHFQDLVALEPTADELAAAAAWVRKQDPSPAMDSAVSAIVEHAGQRR